MLNFFKICRLCLKESSSMQSINNPVICDFIRERVPIEMDLCDGLPDKICNTCFKKLQDISEFYGLCRNNDKFLRDIITSSINVNNSLENGTNQRKGTNYSLSHIHNDFECNEPQKSISNNSFNYSDHSCNNICNKEFSTFRRTKKQKPLTCSLCLETFFTSKNLNNHLKTHKNSKPYKCDSCIKTFSIKQTLIIHQRIHSLERPYLCWYCGKSYKYKHNSLIHMRIHTGECPYKCAKCSQAFRSSSTLKAHMLTHDGNKKFECTVCGKRVARSGDLSIHMRIHTGEKPYACILCPKRYKMSSHLKGHMISHSNIK